MADQGRGGGPPPSSYPPPDPNRPTSEDVPPAEHRMPIGSANAPGPTAASPQPGGPPRGAGAGVGARTPGNRPMGIVILAGLYALSALLLLIGAIAFIAGPAAAPALGPFGGFVMLVALVWLVLAVAAAAVAYGLWMRERWGWYAALALAGVGVVLGLLGILTGDFSAVVNLLVSAVVVWYLLKPDVQAWFGVHHEAPWSYGRPS